MEVVTIEAGAYQNMVGMFETILKTVSSQSEELKSLKDNRLMDIHEVMAYTGFGKTWLLEHKDEIGYMQVASSPLRFYKQDVDKYFLQHKIQKKHK